ncbi:MAG TPA: restriction endonuclease subunit S, partial [Balneolaceae bacterium]|nr:restriction endonuclease subunit S [Balneolaceae bacterium]
MKVVELGSICEFENGDRGKNYPSRSDQVEEGVPFINAGCLKDWGIDSDELNFITEERYNLLSSGKLKQNDILFCLRGSLGKFAINSDGLKGAIASSLVLLRPKKDLNVHYLKNYLKSEQFRRLIERADDSSSQPNLSATRVKKFPIPLPSLSEQKAIVAKLDRAQRLIDIDKEMLAKYDDLIQSVFL